MTNPANSSALKPADAQELAGMLAADTAPVEPIGRGSKRAIGRRVEARPLVLDSLCGIVDYRPAELVLTVLPGTPLEEIDELLADNSQRFAFEPPDLGQLLGSPASLASDGASSGQTIGGVLAANLSGSRRLTAGAARDHLLGVAAVNGRGEAFKAGGKVVKNVTGYDLPKLLAGSWGSLAVMTEVTLKVVPSAETELTLIAPLHDPADAVALLSRALGSAHEVSSAAFDPWRGAALRLEGVDASVAARRSGLLAEIGQPEVETLEAEESQSFWTTFAGAGALAEWPVVWKVCAPPGDAPRILAAIQPERYLLDWGGGLIWAAFDTVHAERVRGALREGHAMLVKAPPGTRTCRLQSPSAVLAGVLDRVKLAFDPDRRLSPGRMD